MGREGGTDRSVPFGVAGLGEWHRLAGTTSRSPSTTYVHLQKFGRNPASLELHYSPLNSSPIQTQLMAMLRCLHWSSGAKPFLRLHVLIDGGAPCNTVQKPCVRKVVKLSGFLLLHRCCEESLDDRCAPCGCKGCGGYHANRHKDGLNAHLQYCALNYWRAFNGC